MAFSEICRICLSISVRMCVLKKIGLQNLYKALTNSFMDEDEEPIIVCFICHARLIRCRALQQQAIESNVVLEQLLVGGSMSIPKPHEARNKIQFTPINHIDIWPVECDIENDCKDDIFSLESVKVEKEIIENENYKFDVNWRHETDTDEQQEDLEIDAFEDRHKDSENNLPLITYGSKSITDDFDKEQPCIQGNNFSKPCEKKIKSNSTDCNIRVDDARKGNLDLETPTIKSKPKLKKNTQLVIKNGEHPAKLMEKKILKQSINILTKNTSEASTKYMFDCSKKKLTKDILAVHILHSHETQKNSDAVQTQGEQTPVSQLMDIYNCDICEFKTSHKRRILSHLKAHVTKQKYCCNNCEYKSITKSHLLSHMKIHTGEKPFSCNICGYRCITKSNLQTHVIIHTGEKPFSCNICEYKCTRKTDLKQHIKVHTGEKPFLCNICEYKCITKSHLLTHMKIHTGEKPFSCNICEYRYITKSHLLRHMKIHTGEKPFSCNICEYRCITKSHLQTHMKIHTGEKPFTCNICEYRGITKSNLLRHMKIHTGEKPFSCNICEFRCITKSHLQTHMKIHTGEKPFTCNICEYRGITKSNLRTHMKIHTGEKPFSCNVCEYKSITKSHLQTHMKIHTGEKPFSCNICEYRCITKSHLQTHMKIHTGEKPFSCNICEYRCITKSNLRKHENTHR